MTSPETPLRIVLADDHHFFREGLRGMLAAAGMQVVGEAADGETAVALVHDLMPDVLVTDLNMPTGPGIEVVRRIAAATPGVNIVVLTVSPDVGDALQALTAGAGSYLLKDTRADELVGGIRLAADGHTVLPGGIARALVGQVPLDSGPGAPSSAAGPDLTGRELEVLRLLSSGADNAAIGRELAISRHTVKQYVTNVFEKLGVHSRVEAAVYAVRNGLV